MTDEERKRVSDTIRMVDGLVGILSIVATHLIDDPDMVHVGVAISGCEHLARKAANSINDLCE